MAWMRQNENGEDSDTATPATPATAATPREPGTRTTVNIGQSVQIKGELTGNEDLIIDGAVDGKIVLLEHNLTIGASGRITAEVHAKTVRVVGRVVGNVTAGDRVEIAATGSIHGDIRAPRVAIADGANFKGSIDMDRKTAQGVSSSVATPARDMPRTAAKA